MPSPTSPLPQVIADRYEILGELGHGGQGATYRVLDTYQNEVVALKLLRGLNPFGPWHEATVLTQLRDEHILPIRNADFFAGTPGIVTELALHKTVAHKIKASGAAGIDPLTAVRWTRQACLAVERTHNACLVHTDIKPENLFLSEHNDVRLGDYGLASLLNADGEGICSGTATTLAPEVAEAWMRGQLRGTTPKSDVYSLGATLYWMLAAQPPFPDDPGQINLPAIIAHRPPKIRDLAPHVSQALSLRIMQAMARNTEARFATAGGFAAALGRIPEPNRTWCRTDEDAGHVGCWRGTRGKHATILVCAVESGRKIVIDAVRLPHRLRIRELSDRVVTKAQLASALRKIFTACG